MNELPECPVANFMHQAAQARCSLAAGLFATRIPCDYPGVPPTQKSTRRF